MAAMGETGTGTGIVRGGVVATAAGSLTDGWIEIEDGRIVGIGDGPSTGPVLAEAAVVLPGFVDQHCHGGGGESFSTTDPDAAAWAVQTHRALGSTTIVASLVSELPATLLSQVETLAPLATAGLIAGIHLEGPWIAQEKCGAHAPEALRSPSAVEIDELLAAGAGQIRMVTLAPELPGALAAIEQLTAADVRVAIGHTACDYETALAAVAAGASVATHLWNAMRPIRHRQPGPIPAILESPEVFVELIADGIHLHPSVIRLTRHVVGIDRVVLVTDAMAAAAAPDGTYRLGTLEVAVTDRVARLAPHGAIAGSTLTMLEAARRAHTLLGWDWGDVALCTATNPARAMGLGDVGAVEPGRAADFVLLDEPGELVGVMKSGVPLA